MNELNSIERTIVLFKKYLKSLPKSFLSKPSNRIFKSRILLNLYLQLQFVQSKLKLFDQALESSKEALKRSQNIIHNTLRSCQDHLSRHKQISSSPVTPKQIKNQQYVLLESPHYQLFHSLVLKSMPILLYLDEKTTFSPRISIPSLPNQSIEDLLSMQPWSFETLIKGPEIMEELERELMIEKIMLHILCHYLIGKLLKFHHTQENQIEARIMMDRAYNMAKYYLPHDNLLFLTVVKDSDRARSGMVNRIRSSSRIKSTSKNAKSDGRSASTNKFRNTPSKKFNETYKENNSKPESLVPLRRKIIAKFKKFKLK